MFDCENYKWPVFALILMAVLLFVSLFPCRADTGEFCRIEKRNGNIAYHPPRTIEAIVYIKKKKHYRVRTSLATIKGTTLPNVFMAKDFMCGYEGSTMKDTVK